MVALREDRGSMNLGKKRRELKEVRKPVSATHISMASHATSKSSSYVVQRHSELATGMDLGLGASE